MPKTLALVGLVIAVLILVLMSVDLAVAPESPGSKITFNIGFILCAIALGTMSYLSYRQHR
jgi:hypothetical protein